MTSDQKNTITEYRRNGLGYKKISQLTGVSENTIKTFCRRNGLGGHRDSRPYFRRWKCLQVLRGSHHPDSRQEAPQVL